MRNDRKGKDEGSQSDALAVHVLLVYDTNTDAKVCAYITHYNPRVCGYPEGYFLTLWHCVSNLYHSS